MEALSEGMAEKEQKEKVKRAERERGRAPKEMRIPEFFSRRK